MEGNSDSDSDASSLGSDESLGFTSGPNFSNFAKRMLYEKSKYYESTHELYAPYTKSEDLGAKDTLVSLDDPLPADAYKPYGNSKFGSAKKDVTTLFMVDSKNRDKSAFPQPTSFTIKPPRVYKNVTSVQITQMKLLGSFFYFRKSKGNTFLPVIERGREAINKFLDFPLTEAVTIPEGTYAINDLLSQLQLQMNYTPLFYDFPSGFSGFVAAFTTNGDLSVNFNQPGDSYYDALNDKYVVNPSMDTIVSYYWGNRYPGLTQYSLDQVKSAYYYPVIYELTLDTTNTTVYPFFNFQVPAGLLEGGQTVTTHILFNSSGLTDPVILYLINNNLALLDAYRLENTFRKYLVNRYQIAYDSNSFRVNILSLTLNTSLINLFNLTSTRNLASALTNNGLSSNAYSNTSNALAKAKVVFTDMYNYIQTQLTTYFAIGFATYSSEYFLTLSNTLYIQNGVNAVGVRTGYTAEYLTSGETPIVSSVNTLSNSPGYWPRFNTANTSGGRGGGIDPSGINVSTSMIPYNINSSNFTFGTQIIDSSNFYIQTDKSSRSVNSLITIKPARYTVFKFKSPARQTLQVETLPLPYYYRFADYNKAGLFKGVLDQNNDNMPQKYFDVSYNFVYSTTGAYQNSWMDSSNYSTLTLRPTFGMNVQAALLSTPVYSLNVRSNYMQYEFKAPYPQGISSGLIAYTTSISFVSMFNPTISTTWAASVDAFLYHDRGAFMADVQFPRQENSNHFIQSATATVAQSDITFNVSTFAGHTYYTIFRSDTLGFPNISFKPIIYYGSSNFVPIVTDYLDFDPLASPYSTSNLRKYPFVTNYNTDFLRLPTSSTLQGIDPLNPKFTTSVVIQAKPIGYDISGVSNDLTDYQGYTAGTPGFVPGTTFRIDPLTQYTFQNLSPFDSNTTTYFDPGTLNRVLEPVTNQTYTFDTISSSQVKIVHWYDGFSIPEQTADGFTTSNAISSGMTSSLLDYVQGFNTNIRGNIIFGQGINAIGFLPTDGVYDIQTFTFKSVLYPTGNTAVPTDEDPNTQIAYIGVFTGSYLASKTIAISSALAVLSYKSAAVYNKFTQPQTPQFGLQFGTWYTYEFDPSFVAESNVKLTGYTQGSNELLSYDSMYYMIPFDSNGSNITYSRLAGSVLPYPLSQVVSSGSTYYGQVAKQVPGIAPQVNYLMPSTIADANPIYGPQGTVAITQSQYELSQPITTTSIGYRDYQLLVNNADALFPFTTTFATPFSTIATADMGLTTHFSEYEDSLYLVNSLSNGTNLSNAGTSFQGAAYASSISSVIALRGGTTDSMYYLLNGPSTLQNFSFIGETVLYSTIMYETIASPTDAITTRAYEFNVSSPNATMWLWGAGGGANVGIGGAGAYAKVEINIPNLLKISTPTARFGVSTVYMVVGRGGDSSLGAGSDPSQPSSNASQVQGYEQLKYGGGGTALYTDPRTGTVAFETRGGGFTGLFTGSNLADPTTLPLIIVGGGGGGGNDPTRLGGQGGFGDLVNASILPDIQFRFSTATFLASSFPLYPFNSIVDLDAVFNISTEPILNAIDSDLTTVWEPAYPPFLNPGNYRPTVKTWRTSLTFPQNRVSSIYKLQVFCGSVSDSQNLPTGLLVYNDVNKNQVLYSNTNIQYGDFEVFTNGEFDQLHYDAYPLAQVNTSPQAVNGFIVGGLADKANTTLQYSLDGNNWVAVPNSDSILNPYYNACGAITYIPGVNIWLTGGQITGGVGSVLDYNAAAGATWATVASLTGTNAAAAVSLLGKYQVVAIGGLYISDNYGSSWSQLSFSYNVLSAGAGHSVTMSTTGRYIAVCVNVAGTFSIRISNNFGIALLGANSWRTVPTTSTAKWNIAMSSSGKCIVANTAAGSGIMLVSTNFGQSFTTVSGLGTNAWRSVSIGGNGTNILAVSNNGVYISNTSGSTWATVAGLTGSVCAISGTGQYMALAQSPGFIYLSSDFGVTWPSIITIPGSLVWSSITMSVSGKYVTAVTSSGFIWVSYNFGQTFTQKGVSATWSSVSMSGNAKYQLATTATAVYLSVAVDPALTAAPILRSSDGINWTRTLVTEFTSAYVTSFAILNGVIYAGLSGGVSSKVLISLDGYTWTLQPNTLDTTYSLFGPGTIQQNNNIFGFTVVNNILYAAGGFVQGNNSVNYGYYGLVYTSNGFDWIFVTSLFILPYIAIGIRAIAYGNGKYVLEWPYGNPPYNNTQFIYSSDSVTWYASTANFPSFRLGSMAFGNGIFVAAGFDNVSVANVFKYSTDGGITWRNSAFTAPGANTNNYYLGVTYGNGLFIATGVWNQTGTNKAPNQQSILTSTDGNTWSPIINGGFNIDIKFSRGNVVAYGPITLVPNLSTLYVELQTTNTAEPYIYEIKALGSAGPVSPQTPSNGTSALIDNNLATVFWPAELETVGFTQYPLVLTFSTPTAAINKFDFYAPQNSTMALFTGLTISLDNTDVSVVYNDPAVNTTDFTPALGYVRYTAIMVPPLYNISTVYFTFNKDTVNSLRLNEIKALYDPNLDILQFTPDTITDLNATGGDPSNAIDGNLATTWIPDVFSAPQTLQIDFTFPSAIQRINRIQIYNSAYEDTEHMITGVYVYTDSNKGTVLYSNDSPAYRQYLDYTLFDITIDPILKATSIYMELSKDAPAGSVPYINEIRFFNVGNFKFSPAGFAAGTVFTIRKEITGIYEYDGGGGGNTIGGIGGLNTLSSGSAFDPTYVTAQATIISELTAQQQVAAISELTGELNTFINVELNYGVGSAYSAIQAALNLLYAANYNPRYEYFQLLVLFDADGYIRGTYIPYVTNLLQTTPPTDPSYGTYHEWLVYANNILNNIFPAIGNIANNLRTDQIILYVPTEFQGTNLMGNYLGTANTYTNTFMNLRDAIPNYTTMASIISGLGIYATASQISDLASQLSNVLLYMQEYTLHRDQLNAICAGNYGSYLLSLVQDTIIFGNGSGSSYYEQQNGTTWYANEQSGGTSVIDYADISPYNATVVNEIASLNAQYAAILNTINAALIPPPLPPNPNAGGRTGGYLTGGSPGSIIIYPDLNPPVSSIIGGGGGGGGYWGGGGGSADGGGGGGSGFVINETLFDILDFGTAVAGSNGIPLNYVPPGLLTQELLQSQDLIMPYPNPTLNFYGQGGISTAGAHGLILITYTGSIDVIPPNSQTAFPNFVDGSKLTLLTAPVDYGTSIRNLDFTTYLDPIETSDFSGYNWVWYRSFLLLTGCSLMPNMTASSDVPSQPTVEFPNLPTLVYTVLAEQFNNVSSFYGGAISDSNVSIITESITIAFNLFQNYFVNTSYLDPSYVEMTEIYGLLDYLQNPVNLTNPHINPNYSPIDRVFGGVPRFGYWANPFLTNASYIGFDVGPSQFLTSPLSVLVGDDTPVTAMYGLVLEQSLSTGVYAFKDIMAYKPTAGDAVTATQFPEAYVVRSLSNTNITSNVLVQPYTMKNAIEGRFPLFQYQVYNSPATNGDITFNVPIQMITDFEGTNQYFYSFQSDTLDDVSTIKMTTLLNTSTTININQTNVTTRSNTASNIIGTSVSEYDGQTRLQAVTQFGFIQTNTNDFTPIITFSNGPNNFYNTYTTDSPIQSTNLGKAVIDYNGNLYEAANTGEDILYQNICTSKIYTAPFSNTSFNYASPGNILTQYLNGSNNPTYDYLVSKYTNLWHLQGTSNLSTIYGARLTSPFDFTITTNFVNQIFYPTHKITLVQKGASLNPIQNALDLSNYPSYSRTEMFYYTSFSNLVADISGQFANERASNFNYSDVNSGFFFDSYIHNINMSKSSSEFNYLAIRAYSPSETFQALVRFYLPGRYDFGYITVRDLSNEIVTIQTDSNVNPEYATVLGKFTSSFAISKIFGGTGLPGFSGSNITSTDFGDFLQQYVGVYSTINTTSVTISSINGAVQEGVTNLITGDLRYILPPFIANRERVNDPLEFKLPLSTIMTGSNRGINEYGLGYNIGFAAVDTEFATIQRAGSFFKILDDYIYLRMNPHNNMNKMDISRQENYAATQDSTAEPQLYNCKLLLNNFGTYSTTFIQNPVSFNPIIGKLDKLMFSWYDITGTLIDNSECEWSAALQIVEKMDVNTDDSTMLKSV